MTRPGLAAMPERGPVVLDGGLATELEQAGHDLADPLWSARLLRDRPGVVEAVHRAYFGAGADVAITASYQGTYEGFAGAGIAGAARALAGARRARHRRLLRDRPRRDRRRRRRAARRFARMTALWLHCRTWLRR